MSDCAAEVSGGFSGKMRSQGDTPRGSGSKQEGPRVEDGSTAAPDESLAGSES